MPSLRKLPALSSDTPIRRNLLLFERYLSGRIAVFQDSAKNSPAEKGECEAVIAELQFIYDNIFPELFRSTP